MKTEREALHLSDNSYVMDFGRKASDGCRADKDTLRLRRDEYLTVPTYLGRRSSNTMDHPTEDIDRLDIYRWPVKGEKNGSGAKDSSSITLS